jgi:hypothetical protein
LIASKNVSSSDPDPLDKFLEKTPTEYSLAQWANEYLGHAKTSYVIKTYNEKKLAFRLLFLSIKPETLPSDLHPGVILKHFDKQAKERTGNAANKDRKNLVAAWNWAITYVPGWPEVNPFAKTKQQKAEEWPRYIPPVEETFGKSSTSRKTPRTDRCFRLICTRRRENPNCSS